MKFIQISDIHVGESRYIQNYLDRHKQLFATIAAKVKELGLPLVIAGDLFHTKKTTYYEYWTAANFLADLDQIGVPVILTPGNHDHLAGNTFSTDIFRLFGFKNIRVVGHQPEVHTIDDVDFVCVAWGDFDAPTMKKLVESKLPQCLNQTKVVVCHETIVGSRADNGIVIPSGVKLPNMPEIKYWAIGDIHSFQPANLQNAWYAGAPMQFKFGDSISRGMLIVDTEYPTKPEFVELPSKKFRVVSSVTEMVDDSYYSLRSDLDTLIEVQDHRVIQKRRVDPNYEPIQVGTLDITNGLTEYLAEKGFGEKEQKWALEWVEQTAKRI